MEVKGTRKVDKSILERSIYALGLLEALARVGMPFIFKGGTSLLLLLESPMRLSTDIDIVVEPGLDFEHYLVEASQILPFKKMEEQKRKSVGSIEKRHYKFTYFSPAFGHDFYILLDILFSENHYTKTVQKPIMCPLINTEDPYIDVTVPTVECILGDKLTAFAPHTTGIPFGVGKEMEIIKQMYDISCLFDIAEDFSEIRDTYLATAKAEISYRGSDISYRDSLWDTIDTAACIAGRGLVGEDYPLLLSGMKAIIEHIFDRRFSAELAVVRSCKVMYVAACVLTNTPTRRINDFDSYMNTPIPIPKYGKLSRIRKLTLEGYAYAVEALNLIK